MARPLRPFLILLGKDFHTYISVGKKTGIKSEMDKKRKWKKAGEGEVKLKQECSKVGGQMRKAVGRRKQAEKGEVRGRWKEETTQS